MEDVELDDFGEFAIFYFEWIESKLMVPGRIENWMLLVDLDGVGITNIPISKLKVFISTI